jgi:predicted Zn-dependent protease with MMP-like domain
MMRKNGKSHDELVRLASDALERDALAEAEALARRALMKQPQSLEARQALASALIEQARYGEAAAFLRELLEEDPDDLATLADYGLCLFELCEFRAAEQVLARALEVEPADPQACYWMALCLERRGQFQQAERYFRLAHEVDPSGYPAPSRISREAFAETVSEALAGLPDEIQRPLRGAVAIIVEDLPREEDLRAQDPPLDPCLYGLYCGVPLPDRSSQSIPELPDRIYLYQRNLERFCVDREMLVDEIRITLLHEIGHYLGFDEEDLAERGLA